MVGLWWGVVQDSVEQVSRVALFPINAWRILHRSSTIYLPSIHSPARPYRLSTCLLSSYPTATHHYWLDCRALLYHSATLSIFLRAYRALATGSAPPDFFYPDLLPTILPLPRHAFSGSLSATLSPPYRLTYLHKTNLLAAW